MTIRTIAIDDEPLALQLVAGYIRKTAFLELAAIFDNPLDAGEFLRKESVDLIFLDIQMPHLLGTEFARMAGEHTRIIFTTAYSQYAIQGYKLDVIDYLLKPFSYDEFLTAAVKARNRLSAEQPAGNRIETNEDYLFLKSEYKIRRINFNDIIYIEGLKDYIKVYLKNEEKPVLSLSTLKTIEDKLPPARFMRVHRSFIVNLSLVSTIERGRIIFGKIYIPVSDQYKEKFQEFLDKNFL